MRVRSFLGMVYFKSVMWDHPYQNGLKPKATDTFANETATFTLKIFSDVSQAVQLPAGIATINGDD